ncbi:MAG: hypothetical protein KDA46_03560, partial [Parvularculaceae bacterium]|nr:hypothetical protein [Parvularculaceae bacterium]
PDSRHDGFVFSGRIAKGQNRCTLFARCSKHGDFLIFHAFRPETRHGKGLGRRAKTVQRFFKWNRQADE